MEFAQISLDLISCKFSGRKLAGLPT